MKEVGYLRQRISGDCGELESKYATQFSCPVGIRIQYCHIPWIFKKASKSAVLNEILQFLNIGNYSFIVNTVHAKQIPAFIYVTNIYWASTIIFQTLF